MNSQTFSEWLASLSTSERIKALALIYSSLTVYSRELFLPDKPKGKEQLVIDMLHGLNEVHHTLANQLLAYAYDEEGHSLHNFSQQLLEIGNRYRIGGFLTSAIEFARTRDLGRGDHP